MRAAAMALCIATLAGCERTGHRGAPPPIPLPPQSAEWPKSLVLQFAIAESTLDMTGIRVEPSRTHTYVGHPDQFRVALLDRDGKVLGEIATYDPRGIRVYPGSNLDSAAFLPVPEGVRDEGPPRRPRRPTIVEGAPAGRDSAGFKEYYQLRDSANAELAVPFVPRVDSIRFSRPGGRPYPAFSVRAALTEYCRAVVADPECQQWLRGR